MAWPACSPALESVPWDIVRREAEVHLGETVHVRGSLQVSPAIGQTAVFCGGDRCCNDSESYFVLASDDPVNWLTLHVWGKDGYPCVGDDSRLCCDHPATGRAIVATGVLEVDPRRFWGKKGYAISRPDICELAP
jgi:hypothetical protein